MLGAVAWPTFLTPEGRQESLGLLSCQEPGLCWKGHFSGTIASETSLSPSGGLQARSAGKQSPYPQDFFVDLLAYSRMYSWRIVEEKPFVCSYKKDWSTLAAVQVLM